MSQNGLRDQLLFKLGVSTGLRCGDLVALTVEQVVKENQNLRFKKAKLRKTET